jgi:cytoskeletal protein RodZ
MSTENKDTESTSEAPIQAGALTQLLSQYRTDARLGHEQVSEALCLPVSSVKALENEEFDKLPEPPYVRGYLRTYSRLAGKDAAEAIKIYDKLHGGKPSTTASYHYSLNKKSGEIKPPLLSESSVRLGVLALFLGIVGLITMQPTINQWMKDTWDSFSSEQSTPKGNKLPGENLIDVNILTGDIPGNLPISDTPKTTNTIQNTEKKTEAESTANNIEDSQNPDAMTASTASTQLENTDTTDPLTPTVTQEVSENTTANKPEDETSNTDTTPPTVGDIKLKLVFTNEAWIRIRGKDKKTVFEALNPANSEKELTLSPPVKFRIGSANGVKVYVNGEEKDISEYIKGSVANFSIE